MKSMRRYLRYLEDYLEYEKKRLERGELPDTVWLKRHKCSCEIKDALKKNFDELHEAFKPVDLKIRLTARAGMVGCSPFDWPSCASDKRILSAQKKK